MLLIFCCYPKFIVASTTYPLDIIITRQNDDAVSHSSCAISEIPSTYNNPSEGGSCRGPIKATRTGLSQKTTESCQDDVTGGCRDIFHDEGIYSERSSLLSLISSKVPVEDVTYSKELQELAEKDNDMRAQYYLGICYDEGNDGVIKRKIEKSETEAIKWWTRSANQGYHYAQWRLGTYYYKKKDYKTAVDLLRLAVRGEGGNNADTLYNLGLCLNKGYETLKLPNHKESIECFVKAARLKDKGAQEALEKLTQVPQNVFENLETCKELQLTSTAITDKNLMFLAYVLPYMRKLELINLSGNNIGDTLTKALITYVIPILPQMEKPITLDLSNNNIEDAAAVALENALSAKPVLTQLDLRLNHIGSTGRTAFLKLSEKFQILLDPATI